jgi:hypothetical protein
MTPGRVDADLGPWRAISRGDQSIATPRAQLGAIALGLAGERETFAAQPLKREIAFCAAARVPMATHFRDAKRVVLHKLGAGTDYSPKGSIDAPVAALCAFINALPPFVTLSSCSGRIAVYAHGPGLATARGSAGGGAAGGDDGDGDTDGSTKGSGRWLFVTHGPHGVTAADIAAALAECDAWPGSSAVLTCQPRACC